MATATIYRHNSGQICPAGLLTDTAIGHRLLRDRISTQSPHGRLTDLRRKPKQVRHGRVCQTFKKRKNTKTGLYSAQAFALRKVELANPTSTLKSGQFCCSTLISQVLVIGSDSLNHFRNSSERFAGCMQPSAAHFSVAASHVSPFAKSNFQPQPLAEANKFESISASWPNLLQVRQCSR